MSLMLKLGERLEMKGRMLTVTQTAFDCLPRTRDFLIDVAREGATVTYGELREQVQLPYAPNGMGRLLDLLSEDCDRRDEPSLAAIVERNHRRGWPRLRWGCRCRASTGLQPTPLDLGVLTNQPKMIGDHMSNSDEGLPPDWAEVLADALTQPYWADLQRYVTAERSEQEVYPAPENVFAAFKATPFEEVRVVILGQDPYRNPGEATGLAFAVPDGTPIPPSLRNILNELRSDLGATSRSDLTGWATQGVLLLNTTLTVSHGESNSHEGHGWETFTDAVISAISAREERVVFVLWGAPARSKRRLINTARHKVIEAAHPKAWANAHDPLGGSKPFSQVNKMLRGEPIDWSAS